MARPPWRPPLPSTGVASALKWGRSSSHDHDSMQSTTAHMPAHGFEPRTSRSGASAITNYTTRARNAQRPGKSTFYSLCLTAQCASARRSRDDADDDVQPAPDDDLDLSATGRARRPAARRHGACGVSYHYYVIDDLVDEARRQGACRADAYRSPTSCPLAASRPLFLTGASAYEARRQGESCSRPTVVSLGGEPPPLPHWGAG